MEEIKTIHMSEEEEKEFLEFKRQKEEKARKEQLKQQKEAYESMVSDLVETTVGRLQWLSKSLADTKKSIYGDFESLINLKKQIYPTKTDQFSHTFINEDCTSRITLGVNVVDNYKDTVEEGIQMVKDYIESLVTDENSKKLVNAVLRLLAHDQKGKLKAQNILKLRQLADESDSEEFKNGVKVIEDSYIPTKTKTYIRAEVKDPITGKWTVVPLTMTDL